MYTHCTHIYFISKYKYIYWIYIFFNFFLYVRSYNLYTHMLKIFVLEISKQVAIFDGIPLVYIYNIYIIQIHYHTYIYINIIPSVSYYIYIYIYDFILIFSMDMEQQQHLSCKLVLAVHQKRIPLLLFVYFQWNQRHPYLLILYQRRHNQHHYLFYPNFYYQPYL